MNWFKGSIAEAVTISKQKNATFVVYVEGKDENSVKLTGFLNQPTIREKLEGDCFVAIKIEGGSESYMQFARIYQIVPLPSLFFIGKNGTPLEIATGVIASSDELDKKIENVLKLTGQSLNKSAASASAAFISAEQRIDPDSPIASTSITTDTNNKELTTNEASPNIELKSVEEPSSNLSTTEPPTSILDTEPPPVVELSSSPKEFSVDATRFEPPKVSEDTSDPPSENASTFADSISMDTVPTPPVTPTTPNSSRLPSGTTVTTAPAKPAPTPTTPAPTPTASAPPLDDTADEATPNARVQQLVETRRKYMQAQEERQERERELNRRKEGKNVQNVQQWQKEQELKDLKESIRRDRLEDQAARQRILEQIASDRAERAQKFSVPAANTTAQPTTPNTVNAPSTNMTMSRIQFRIPNGETSTQTFESDDTFATVRAYVKVEVIKGTGIKDFTLATTFPKHEFTAEDDRQTLLSLGLAPSAVILVIAKTSSGPSAVVARSGGIVNVFNTIFWALMSPVIAVFGYLRNFIIGRNDDGADPRPGNAGAQKRASEEHIDANHLAKKRNLDRFQLTKDGPSTSKDPMAAANSTAGGAYRRVGGSNVHRLSDQRKDSDDENNTWNGNSTQQQ